MKGNNMTKALVVLSGGQDSMTCLGLAMKEQKTVLAVSFFYNQKHSVELEAAEYICGKYSITQFEIDLSPILENMTSSALITHGDTEQPHPILRGLPAS